MLLRSYHLFEWKIKNYLTYISISYKFFKKNRVISRNTWDMPYQNMGKNNASNFMYLIKMNNIILAQTLLKGIALAGLFVAGMAWLLFRWFEQGG